VKCVLFNTEKNGDDGEIDVSFVYPYAWRREAHHSWFFLYVLTSHGTEHEKRNNL
jgi:hypothetical protein